MYVFPGRDCVVSIRGGSITLYQPRFRDGRIALLLYSDMSVTSTTVSRRWIQRMFDKEPPVGFRLAPLA